MALAKIYTGTVVGLEAIPITVEVNVENRGFPAFNIVGLPSKEVDESKLRIRSAIINSKYNFPDHKITVNLAPASIPKEGSLYDLPIAVGILKATKQITSNTNEKLFLGELSLDGNIKEIKGVAVIGDLIERYLFKYLYIPKNNSTETAFIENCYVRCPKNLNELVKHLEGLQLIKQSRLTYQKPSTKFDVLIEDVQEQEHAKRAIIIAAAGGHNIALTGPPGTGKSMLAKAMQSILPDLSKEERKEVIRIKSLTGLSKDIHIERPYRAPHHTISKVGLIGGGSKISPGEITLAHRGILFMDEFNEFPRSVLESLRQPLEDRYVTISRASGSITFPTSFSLVVANNPCPCGYWNSNIKECSCRISDIKKYQKRVSGPIWDRIDLHITMKEFKTSKINFESKKNNYGEETKNIKEQVEKAREIQKYRYKNTNNKTNAEQTNKSILKYINISKDTRNILDSATEKLNLSPRAYFKVLKIARTIADLAEEKRIKNKHILEALSYRNTNQEM